MVVPKPESIQPMPVSQLEVPIEDKYGEQSRKPKLEKPRSRADRFQKAAQAVLDRLDELESALESLREVRSEYEDWQSNLPENLQSSVLGEKLEAICGIDLDHDLCSRTQ